MRKVFRLIQRITIWQLGRRSSCVKRRCKYTTSNFQPGKQNTIQLLREHIRKFAFSTNHVFVLAQKPDVSSLSRPMLGLQQTMWVSFSSATLRTSQYDASWDHSDDLLQWSSVLVVWSQGGDPGVSNQWPHAAHNQGHVLQGLGTEKTNWFSACYLQWQYSMLTNSEAGMLWSFTSSRVGDHTPIVACVARLDTPHLKCATFTREVLPPILLTLLSKRFTLPLVAQRLCTSGLDWERNCLPWNSILMACWLRCNFRRFGCKSEWKIEKST